jgi:hypothetical protein
MEKPSVKKGVFACKTITGKRFLNLGESKENTSFGLRKPIRAKINLVWGKIL